MVLVVIGALAYFGVLSPDKFMPETYEQQLEMELRDVGTYFCEDQAEELINMKIYCGYNDLIAEIYMFNNSWNLNQVNASERTNSLTTT